MSTGTRGHLHKFVGSDGWPTEDPAAACTVCQQTWAEITTAPAPKAEKDRDMTASSIENRKSDARFAASVRWK